MTMMLLIRHGQTDWNVEARYQGQTDVPLNAAGVQQAQALAAELSGQHFDAVFSSPLQRARLTARIIADELLLSVQIDERLIEIHQGKWEGEIYNDLLVRFPEEMRARREDPYRFRPPEGESAAEVAARVARAADDIARLYPGGRVVVVSHALTLAALYCQANQLPLGQVYDHLPRNAHPVAIEWPPAPMNPKDIAPHPTVN
ncbi:MAG: histidine phosphatase family protein [Anaerolineaceae bacterium]